MDGGERAVIFNRFDGVQQRVFAPGTHFKIPGIEEPTIYDVRTRPRVINTVTGTKDLQMVNISLRVLSRPKAEECHLIHSELGPDYDDRVDWVHDTYVPAITNMATPANTVSLSMTPKDYLLMRVTQLDHCIGCRNPLAGGGYQLEHSVPRSRGGENSVKACSLMCGTEHGCKTARDNSTVRRGFDAIRQVHWYASMARALRMPIDDGGITFPWAIERD